MQKADSCHTFKISAHAASRTLSLYAHSFLTPSFTATRPCARVKLVNNFTKGQKVHNAFQNATKTMKYLAEVAAASQMHKSKMMFT